MQGRETVSMDHLQETIYCEFNDHVTDDVMWSLKVKVETPKVLTPYISLTMQDRHMVVIDHQ